MVFSGQEIYLMESTSTCQALVACFSCTIHIQTIYYLLKCLMMPQEHFSDNCLKDQEYLGMTLNPAIEKNMFKFRLLDK